MATEFKLVASGTYQFGRAVALSGDYAIVGAREKSGFPGSAYVFVKNGTGWAEQAKLSGSIKQETDDFGFAVAIEGDYAIVGARYTVGPPYGRAYVFHRNGSNWVEESVLVPGDPMAPWIYLRSIALSGDSALLGTDAALHFFQRTGSTWTEQPKLTGYFYPVSLSGNYLVNLNSRAYVFQRNGTTWQQQAVLTAKDDFYAGSVSISGDYIIVGVPNADTVTERGAAYVFARSGPTWIQQAKLKGDAGFPLSEFGSSVAISGDYALVGAPVGGGFPVAGAAAYIFHRTDASWLLVEKIIAKTPVEDDNFGDPVAIDGSVVGGQAIVGAPLRANSKGEAYILSAIFNPNPCQAFRDAVAELEAEIEACAADPGCPKSSVVLLVKRLRLALAALQACERAH